MNWGPRSETISSGRPKFLKTWLNIHSPVSKAVASPLRGINLHAFEKQSTVTRTQVLPSELGRSTTKSIPYLGPGPSWDWQWHEFCLLGGVGASSTWHRLSSCGRTGWHPGSYWTTRTELEGAIGSVCCLGVQSPEYCALSPRRGWRCDEGFSLLGLPAELVRWVWRHWCSQRCSTGWDWRWGMMGSGYEWDSREYRRDKASALQLRFPGR